MPITHEHMVLGHPESASAARNLAQALGCHYDQVDLHHFPDGESRVNLPTRLAKHVIIYRSLDRPNDKLVELLLTARSLRENGVLTITLVAPYLCYMRQDCAFEPGDVVSQQVIGEFLSQQIDYLLTVDPHLHRIHELSQAVPCRKALHISAAPLFRDFLNQHYRDAVLLGPDAESQQWVASIAGNDYRYGVANKQRFGDRQVEIQLPGMELHQQTIVLIDDVISTGQTLMKTVEAIRRQQVTQVVILVTHALFADTEFDQALYDHGVTAIISTDSIPHRTNQLSLALSLAKCLTDNNIV